MILIMKSIIADQSLVAFCGLYCGACGKYLKGKCVGCHENNKAGWCSVRACNIQNNYQSCADCKEFTNPMDCKKFNNFFSKVFALILKSDRAACIAKIKAEGYSGFSVFMAEHKQQTIKRN
jgi:hypothetical protein